MFFEIKNPNNFNINLIKNYIKTKAKESIILFPTYTAEIQLDKYFRNKYHKNLKEICLQIVNDILILKNNENNLIIKFKSQKTDKLAQFITYGNRQIKGSKIITKAFCRKY